LNPLRTATVRARRRATQSSVGTNAPNSVMLPA
jgi:hypothetical protein